MKYQHIKIGHSKDMMCGIALCDQYNLSTVFIAFILLYIQSRSISSFTLSHSSYENIQIDAY